MDFLLKIAGIVIFSTLAFLLIERLGDFFTYEEKRKKREMLTNQEIATSDRFIKFVVWALNIQIPILAVLLPFILWHWSALYQYYLLGIFCYAIVAFYSRTAEFAKT